MITILYLEFATLLAMLTIFAAAAFYDVYLVRRCGKRWVEVAFKVGFGGLFLFAMLLFFLSLQKI